MKNKTLPIMTLLSSFALVAGLPTQDDKDMFLPEVIRPSLFQTDQKTQELNEQAKKDAIQSGEGRPAELDPEGHWGEIRDGFQMSLRSNTNCFVAGQPMPVSVVFRNTTTNSLMRLKVRMGPLEGGEVHLSAENESGQVINSPIGGGMDFDIEELPAKRQDKYQYDLNDWLHLGVGIYKVRAQQMVFPSPGAPISVPGQTNVYSGVLVIKVVAQ